MFNGNKKERAAAEGKIDTVLGERTKIEGNLKTSDTTHISGELLGDIVSDGMLIIGETGIVRGNISSANILVAGTVEGNLNITEKLTITSTGKIAGEILTHALIIDEGAVFEGSCNMLSTNGAKGDSGQNTDTQRLTMEAESLNGINGKKKAANSKQTAQQAE